LTTSLTLSIVKPATYSTTPATSRPVPKLCCAYRSETLGELSTVTGRLTVQTQTIWNSQKPRKGRNLSRLSSKRSSFPVRRMRKRRKPERRRAQMMRKREATIWRAWCWWLRERVRMERRAKLVPPAKSGQSVSQSLTGIVVSHEERGRDGEMGTCEFIKLKGKGYGKEEELVADGDEGRDGEVVVVEDVHGTHGG
jgi:hypothetical protein